MHFEPSQLIQQIQIASKIRIYMSQGFCVLRELLLLAAWTQSLIVNIFAFEFLRHKHRPIHISSFLSRSCCYRFITFLRLSLWKPIFPLFRLHLPRIKSLRDMRNNLRVRKRGHKKVKKRAEKDEKPAHVREKS